MTPVATGCYKRSIAVFGVTRRYGGCSSAGRAPDCGSGRRGFEPRHPPHDFQSLADNLRISTRFRVAHGLSFCQTSLAATPRISPQSACPPVGGSIGHKGRGDRTEKICTSIIKKHGFPHAPTGVLFSAYSVLSVVNLFFAALEEVDQPTEVDHPCKSTGSKTITRASVAPRPCPRWSQQRRTGQDIRNQSSAVAVSTRPSVLPVPRRKRAG